MQKKIAILMTALLLLAGCTDPTEESVIEAIEEIVPGCNDEAAYNYNQSAENDLACFSETVLIDSINDFVKLTSEGPAAGETAGYTDMWSGPMDLEGDEMDVDATNTMMVSPEGSYVSTIIGIVGLMETEESWLALPTSDGTMLYVDYNGEKFSMISATPYADMLEDIMGEEEPDNTAIEGDVFICSNGQEIPLEWVDDGYEDCDDGSDENSDIEAGIDLTEYDFSTANFSVQMNPMDSVSAYEFSADMTLLDSDVHSVTIIVNALFEIRSIEIDIDANDESGKFILHTADEIAAMLGTDISDYSSKEALPFVVEEDWYGYDIEPMTYNEDGSPMFLTLYVCMEGVDATMIGNSSVMEVWNDTSLDTSLCDTEVMDGHIFAENETFNLPLEFFINDIFNGVASSVAHDGMNMTITYALDSESAEECTENGGTYDSTMNTSLCTESIGAITQSDSQAFELDLGFEDGEGMLYQYDDVTGSILLITADDMFECDSGELIDSSQWNDGMLDCSDGSDEPDNSDSEFVDGWYCEAFMDTSVIDGNDFNDLWNMTNLNTSMCGTIVENLDHPSNKQWNGVMNMSNVTIPYNFTILGYDDNVLHTFQHNGTHITRTATNWSEIGEECYGDYNQTTDVCTDILPIVNGDEEAVEYTENGENKIAYYQYDLTTDSGLFMHMKSMFECASGELIGSEYYEDGQLHCEDGSDETFEEDEFWFYSVYDEDTWEQIGFEFAIVNNHASFNSIELGIVAEEDYYMSEDNYNVQILHSMALETFSTNENGMLSTVYSMETLEENAEVENYALGDDCHILFAFAYDSDNVLIETLQTYVCFNDDDGYGEGLQAFQIVSGDAPFMFEGNVEEYSIVLSYCDTDYDGDTGEETTTCMDTNEASLTLQETTATVSDLESQDYLDDAAEDGQYVFFMDADDSGTLSDGDMVYINNNDIVVEEWNTVRLYSSSADAYSDENPSLPGFTGMLATLSLLGAAFIRRQEA
ncbi:LDL receptor domain-containing protein [Poseidonia sp.]|uniref:LDL receptor domain-containing protein n=1 Tax=Poseidonia sp. TaxID=2666344 RepID=UPI003F6A3510